MTVTSQTAGGILERGAISLPLLRPVAKPIPMVSRTQSALVTPVKEATSEPVRATVASVPPTVQSVQKLDIEQLRCGDKVVVRTANSTYNFEISGDARGTVIPSKPAARSGGVVLMGGTNVDASEHTPHAVYVGGRMAYQFPDEESAILTSVVESIFRVQAKESPQV